MGHALARRPVDICKQRGEKRVVLGNAGVVRVLETGPQVTTVQPDELAIVFCVGVEDRWGYPDKIFGFDAAHTIGCLAKRTKLKQRQLIPIPAETKHSLPQWAAFSLRYITAWANWRIARGVFRLQVPESECPSPHVWGWGGGVTIAEIDLARRDGCQTAMLSGTDEHLQNIRSQGIEAIDRREFGTIDFDTKRYQSDPDYKAAYTAAEKRFLTEVEKRTGGEMVHIFLDYVGSPVYRATLKALSREGVLATAGWKEGMQIWHLRASECIKRHQHVHTHYARYSEGLAAVAYAEKNDWLPQVSGRLYGFDEIPELADDYAAGKTSYFPCFTINPVD